MNELWLIAHKVSGEPAFDVATQMDCPECMDAAGTNYGCVECDNLGYWWIIPTSGHRAYPYWAVALNNIDDRHELSLECWRDLGNDSEYWPPEMPSGLQDHYHATPAPRVDIRALFRAWQPRPTIPRRL